MGADAGMSVVLAGDVGGTKTNLGLFRWKGPRTLVALAVESFFSADFRGADEMLAEFLKMRGQRAKPSAAAFGAPGPVRDGRVRGVNLPWPVNAEALAKVAGLRGAGLMNDLVANARGLDALKPRDFWTLNRGFCAPGGARALVSAGTGLGQAFAFWDGSRYRAVPSEAGHSDFGPRDRFQIRLLEHLMKEYGHVSLERVLSGPGLHAIYAFLKKERFAREPRWLGEELDNGDPSAVIASSAIAGRSALCARALEVFVEIYGAAAGNAALSGWATGGVFLGGGIAPKILPALKRGGVFMRAFLDKGRHADHLARMPVRVILNDRAALLGAALAAGDRAKERL